MANKKKSKKGTNRKGTAKKKAKRAKGVPKKSPTRTQATRKKKKVILKKRAGRSQLKKRAGRSQRSPQNANRIYNHTEGVAIKPERSSLRSGRQSGDMQALPDIEGPDSESVDELLEEGNAFEADVVAGVEHAEDDEEREVHTHEVPEDDVPEEYLDKD